MDDLNNTESVELEGQPYQGDLAPRGSTAGIGESRVRSLGLRDARNIVLGAEPRTETLHHQGRHDLSVPHRQEERFRGLVSVRYADEEG